MLYCIKKLINYLKIKHLFIFTIDAILHQKNLPGFQCVIIITMRFRIMAAVAFSPQKPNYI
jgi:hypothetical protein